MSRDLRQLIECTDEPVVLSEFLPQQDLDGLLCIDSIQSIAGLNSNKGERLDVNQQVIKEDMHTIPRHYLRKSNMRIKTTSDTLQRVTGMDIPFLSLKGQYWIWLSQGNHTTPLHRDTSSSVMLQLRGEKIWTIYTPEHNTVLFKDVIDREEAGYHLSDLSVDRDNIPSITLHVKPNNLIYVPRNWSHEVKTISPSVSINCFL